MLQIFGGKEPETPAVRAARLRSELASAELELARSAARGSGSATTTPIEPQVEDDVGDSEDAGQTADNISFLHGEPGARGDESGGSPKFSSLLWRALSGPIGAIRDDADVDPFEAMDREERARVDWNFDPAYETPWAREEVI